MGNIYKATYSVIKASSANTAFIIQSTFNAEKVIVDLLRQYLQETDFSSVYPNFGVRVGTVHPFAMLMYEDISGQKINVDVFPSITVSDSSESETNTVLSKGFEAVTLAEADVAKMISYKDRGELFCSDANMVRLQNAVKLGNVYAELLTLRSLHNVDLNIWADNKDITSELYDITRMFVLSKIRDLHKRRVDVSGTLSGRRSGDINVEFGKILYGANVTAPFTAVESVMRVDLAINNISQLKLQQLNGEYHSGG